MSFSKVATFVAFLAFISTASAHGFVKDIIVLGENKNYPGFDPDTDPFKPASELENLIAWSTSGTQQGYISSASYDSPDFICHKNAKPAPNKAQIQAGDKVRLEWSPWPGPPDHQGPIINYLASCNGPCSSVQKESLKWAKIDETGLFPNGTWATDVLRSNGNTWDVKIPSDLAPGEYVLRHEIIALHSASNPSGAQHYMQCSNFEVTGSGNTVLQGVSAAELYKPTDPGISFNFWKDQSVSSYHIPGPTRFVAGAGNDSGSSAPSTLMTLTKRPIPTSNNITSGNDSYGAISAAPKHAKGFYPVCNARSKHGSTMTLTTLAAPPAMT